MKYKRNFTKDHFREYQHFFLRREVWQAIKKTHGWRNHGAITKFAECLGITRQYADMLVKQKAGCSADAMRRILKFLGIKNGECWCHVFSFYENMDVDPKHPIYNSLKHDGAVPYEKYSDSAELRKKDYRAEKKSDFSLAILKMCAILDNVMRNIKKTLTQNQIKNPGSFPCVSTRIGVTHDTGVLFFSGLPLSFNFRAYLVNVRYSIATTYVGLLNNFTKLSMSWSEVKDRLFFLPSRCAWSGFQVRADQLRVTDRWLNN